jgi:hypothetical protein
VTQDEPHALSPCHKLAFPPVVQCCHHGAVVAPGPLLYQDNYNCFISFPKADFSGRDNDSSKEP